jgi:predicted AAA+ superfamily ATPase
MDLLNQDYFVDKSNIINDFNKLISKNSDKYVCITKPRRFGKTSIAAMLVTYYSEGIPSKGIFDKLKVSKGKSSDKKEKKTRN